MEWVRAPEVAGHFYPGDEATLARLVSDLLAEVPDPGDPGPLPKAVIAPHAGYVYSGPVAASAYRRLRPFGDRFDRVLLLGPAHRFPFQGLATSSARAFDTPLGRVPVDPDARARALETPHVHILDAAHVGEHSLEVHLPFLQAVLGSFRILPLLVGEATQQEVSRVLEDLWGGEDTLVVVSSDLSHFLPYERAERLDEDTASAIENLRPEDIRPHQACGRTPVGGLLLRARAVGLNVERLDLRNSGDTAGPRDRVVGYGSFLFT